MAEQTIRNVTQLDRVEHIEDEDFLVLVRAGDDGQQVAYQFRGKNFRGEDAYQLAKEKYGYAGTYEEWLADVEKVVRAEGDINKMRDATAKAESLNEHPSKIGDNGNWWQWNYGKQAYEDMGVIARGGSMYPTFKHVGNKLYIVDYGSNVSERVVKKGNKLIFKI